LICWYGACESIDCKCKRKFKKSELISDKSSLDPNCSAGLTTIASIKWVIRNVSHFIFGYKVKIININTYVFWNDLTFHCNINIELRNELSFQSNQICTGNTGYWNRPLISIIFLQFYKKLYIPLTEKLQINLRSRKNLRTFTLLLLFSIRQKIC
jgi:hypothetical protein